MTFIPGKPNAKRRRAAMQAALYVARKDRVAKLRVSHVFSTLSSSSLSHGALSAGNLAFTSDGAGVAGGALNATPQSTGKLYFEVTVNTLGSNQSGTDGVGLSGPTATFSGLGPSVAQHGIIVYLNNGDCYANGTLKGNTNGGGPAPSSHSTLGFSVDFGAGTLKVQDVSNGGTLTGPFTLPTETTLVPVVVANDNAATTEVTFNFGASAFVGTLPSGFSAWG